MRTKVWLSCREPGDAWVLSARTTLPALGFGPVAGQEAAESIPVTRGDCDPGSSSPGGTARGGRRAEQPGESRS